MKRIGQPIIKYENPPIDEIICGIRFGSIEQLRSGHLGILWQKFRRDFPNIEDQNLVGPVSRGDSENSNNILLPRVWFIHENENELIQVQYNRFLHNWRKIRLDDEYPGYDKIIENFEKYLSRFREFLVEENLGNLVTKEYELSYIDLIPRGYGWENFGDLGKVFPSLLSSTGQSILSTNISSINWQTILDLPNNHGRLRIAIRSAARISDNHQLLHIEFNAHGNRQDESMRVWFDIAHNAVTELFSNLVSKEIQEKFWGQKSW